MKDVMTHAEVVDRLLRACRIHGDLAVSRRLGLSRAYLINLRNGRVRLGEKCLSAMGVDTLYRFTPEGKRLWG